MFKLTSEEEVVRDQLAVLEASVESTDAALKQAFRSFTNTPEATATLKAEAAAAQKALKDCNSTEIAQVVALKIVASEAIEQKLQGLKPEVFLTLAEQLLDPGTNPELVRVAVAFRKLVLNILVAAADVEIQDASARCTKARWDALVKAGFDPLFASEIILAEASKPYPNINLK